MHVSNCYNMNIIEAYSLICEDAHQYGYDNVVDISGNVIDQIDYILFSLQIDSVIKGDYPKRDMVMVLEHTPQILNDIGLPNIPIVITQKHIYTIINRNGKYNNVNYHGLGSNTIKQIPNSIKKPLYVLKSRTRDDSVLVITKLKDDDNRPIVASIKINGKGQIKNIQLNANVLTSVYGKNNYNKFLNDNILFGNLLYDDQIGIIKKLDTTDRKQ